jgi:hypothetical protein
MGSPLGAALYDAIKCTLVLRYHGILKLTAAIILEARKSVMK